MRRIAFIMTAVLAIAFVACDDETELLGQEEIGEEQLDVEATAESVEEDIDNITEAVGFGEIIEGGRTEEDEVLECAEVSVDTTNQIITIDYGDGCEGRRGRVRAGIIQIQYSGRRFIPGSSRITTFENFSIDGVQIEGTRTITNVSEDLSDNPSFNITLVGGLLTFEDETTYSRESNRTRTWFQGANPLEDYTIVTGSASGVNREGLSYSMTITEELRFERTCQRGGVFIPVSGVKVFTRGENEASIDYGDGECDNLVTVTRNGESEEVNLNPRRRFRRG